ncbi:hypothetical protein AC249_AIPGENE22135 [Exaiptasia diaphana]|nr:hypothetical protein AC249_AIPGENE22135 [Exaiptasia diaphana]
MSSFYSSRDRSEDSRQESVDEASEEENGERDSDASGTSGNVTDEDDAEYVSRRQEEERVRKPSICRRVCSVCFRFVMSVILLIALSIATVIFLNHNTSYKLQRDHLPKALLEILDPIATLVHNRRPPS